MATAIHIAKVLLTKKYPLYATLLAKIRLFPTLDIPTLAVNERLQLFFNPKYLEGLDHDQGMAVLWHEMQHVTDSFVYPKVLQRNPKFNVAADLHINCRGKKLGLSLPDDLLFPDKKGLPDGLSTAEYLQKLETDPHPLGAPGEMGAGSGSCWASEAVADAAGAPSRADPVYIAKAKDDFARAVEAHLGRGGGSGDLLSWARAHTAPPKIPWERVLASTTRGMLTDALRGSGDDTYAWLDPGSYVRRGVLVPGEEGSVVQPVFIADTSGSMGERELSMLVREIRGVFTSMGVQTVRLLHADTKVVKDELLHVSKLQQSKLQMVGGGGTDFGPPLEYAKKYKPPLVVYLTDGDGNFPEPPGYPVLWALTSQDVAVPFGRKVLLK